MASELRVNTLKDASGNNSIATSFVAAGSAKVTCNMTDSAGSTSASNLNVSSVADGGAGVNTVNLTSAFSAIKAAVPTGICHDETNNRVVSYDDTSASALPSRTTICSSGSATDGFDYTLVAHGDLA